MRHRFLATAVLVFAALPAAAQDVSIEQGFNRKGSDYNQFRTEDLEVCRRACSRDRRCAAYTFNSIESLCYLKDSVPGQSRDSRTVSGVKSGYGYDRPSSGGGWEEAGVNRPGSDYSRFRTQRIVECQDACDRDRRCRSYTFNSKDDTCYLKDRVPAPTRDAKTTSGVKGSGGWRPPSGGSGGGGGSITEEIGYDRRGNDYSRLQTRGLEGCKNECRREDRCVAYTFDVREGICYLKDRVNPPQRGNDKVTGVKRGW
ncbi:MAG: PAN/Apple domain-containing protein [Thermoanaerobaculia bacterium]